MSDREKLRENLHYLRSVFGGQWKMNRLHEWFWLRHIGNEGLPPRILCPLCWRGSVLRLRGRRPARGWRHHR